MKSLEYKTQRVSRDKKIRLKYTIVLELTRLGSFHITFAGTSQKDFAGSVLSVTNKEGQKYSIL